ncbi:MAG: hypothetical protein ACFB20_11795 [Opitutales bacterium]
MRERRLQVDRGRLRTFRWFWLTLVALTPQTLPALDPLLEPVVRAHGGLERWARVHALEFTYASDFAGYKVADRQIWDPHGPWRLRIDSTDETTTGKRYQIAYDGEHLWIAPNIDALAPLTPHFYYKTPAYFLGIPFVFADPGARVRDLGLQRFEGETFQALEVRFADGTGDTPEDVYWLYTYPQTHRLKLIYYIATHPELIGERSVESLRRETVLYDEWQDVGGLLLSRKARYAVWQDDGRVGEALGGWRFDGLRLHHEPLGAEPFARPEGSVRVNPP